MTCMDLQRYLDNPKPTNDDVADYLGDRLDKAWTAALGQPVPDDLLAALIDLTLIADRFATTGATTRPRPVHSQFDTLISIAGRAQSRLQNTP